MEQAKGPLVFQIEMKGYKDEGAVAKIQAAVNYLIRKVLDYYKSDVKFRGIEVRFIPGAAHVPRLQKDTETTVIMVFIRINSADMDDRIKFEEEKYPNKYFVIDFDQHVLDSFPTNFEAPIDDMKMDERNSLRLILEPLFLNTLRILGACTTTTGPLSGNKAFLNSLTLPNMESLDLSKLIDNVNKDILSLTVDSTPLKFAVYEYSKEFNSFLFDATESIRFIGFMDKDRVLFESETFPEGHPSFLSKAIPSKANRIYIIFQGGLRLEVPMRLVKDTPLRAALEIWFQ